MPRTLLSCPGPSRTLPRRGSDPHAHGLSDRTLNSRPSGSFRVRPVVAATWVSGVKPSGDASHRDTSAQHVAHSAPDGTGATVMAPSTTAVRPHQGPHRHGGRRG